MKKFLNILSGFAFLLATYVFVSVFAAVFCFAGDAFETFKNSNTMLVVPENVEITGNDRMTREDILLTTGLDRKVSFFDVDEKKIELNLTTCGWVKKAFAEKFFPNSVKITVEEFKPMMIVNSRKKSPDSDKDVFTMWFSDSDGILFKRALPNETDSSIPVFFLNYPSQEGDKKRSERIKKAIFIAEKWNNVSSLCKLETMTYEVLAGYSIECAGKNGLKTVVHLKEDFSDDEWVAIMENVSDVAVSLLDENKWAGEYEIDRRDGTLDGRKYEIIYGKLVQNIKKGSIDGQR
ncbi:FtsQ-type POTRA domain-containing protein [bacterium]|nr:FtsQ-type POTRA domain-containing protein [bacterium]